MERRRSNFHFEKILIIKNKSEMMIKNRYILEIRFPIVAPNSLGFLYPMIKLGIKKILDR